MPRADLPLDFVLMRQFSFVFLFSFPTISCSYPLFFWFDFFLVEFPLATNKIFPEKNIFCNPSFLLTRWRGIIPFSLCTGGYTCRTSNVMISMELIAHRGISKCHPSLIRPQEKLKSGKWFKKRNSRFNAHTLRHSPTPTQGNPGKRSLNPKREKRG